MQPMAMTKFGFRIRTRTGAVVENLAIFGRDEDEAERKLRQMYNDCEIIEAHSLIASLGGRHTSASYEDVVELISAS